MTTETGTDATREYRLRSGVKTLLVIVGILLIPLVVTIPFSIMMFLSARRGRIEVSRLGITVRLMGTRTFRWEDIAELRWKFAPKETEDGRLSIHTPLEVTLKKGTGVGAVRNVAIHWFDNPTQLVNDIQEIGGCQIKQPHDD